MRRPGFESPNAQPLTPAIAGIVVGITSMIVTILGKLAGNLSAITVGSAEASSGSMKGLVDLFGKSIPTYYFQIIVELYVIEIGITKMEFSKLYI